MKDPTYVSLRERGGAKDNDSQQFAFDAGSRSISDNTVNSKGWSFANQRWGEHDSTFDFNSICVFVWPWYRVILIAIGIGAIEFIPVMSLAWIVETKTNLIEDIFDSNGIGLTLAVSLAYAVGFITIASGLVVFVSHMAGGSGIPGIISYLNSGYIPHKELLTMKTVAVKAIAIVLTIGGGIVVGREGPAIHIGAGTGDILFRFIDRCAPSNLKLVQHTSAGDVFDGESAHESVIIGASAGFATAFGSPIGAMLYVWEEMSAHWDNVRHVYIGARCFLGVALSTLVLKVLVSSVSENYNLTFNSIVIFDDNTIYGEETWEYSDLLAICVLAVVLGVFSGTMSLACQWMHRFNKKSSYLQSSGAKIMYCVAIACLTAVLFTTVPLALSKCIKKPYDDSYDDPSHRRLSGGSATRSYIQYNCEEGYYNELASFTLVGQEGVLRHLMARDEERIAVADLAVFLIIFTAMAILPFGSSVPAGSFVPTMTIGALSGRIWGELVYSIKSMGSEANDFTKPGVFAVLGAAAMLGGWTRTMMAIVVTMSEITGDVSLTIPMIFAIVICREVASWISHHSFTHSLVDHLEDKDYATSPGNWFNSRDKRRRKSREIEVPSEVEARDRDRDKDKSDAYEVLVGGEGQNSEEGQTSNEIGLEMSGMIDTFRRGNFQHENREGALDCKCDKHGHRHDNGLLNSERVERKATHTMDLYDDLESGSAIDEQAASKSGTIDGKRGLRFYARAKSHPMPVSTNEMDTETQAYNRTDPCTTPPKAARTPEVHSPSKDCVYSSRVSLLSRLRSSKLVSSTSSILGDSSEAGNVYDALRILQRVKDIEDDLT